MGDKRVCQTAPSNESYRSLLSTFIQRSNCTLFRVTKEKEDDSTRRTASLLCNRLGFHSRKFTGLTQLLMPLGSFNLFLSPLLNTSGNLLPKYFLYILTILQRCFHIISFIFFRTYSVKFQCPYNILIFGFQRILLVGLILICLLQLKAGVFLIF